MKQVIFLIYITSIFLLAITPSNAMKIYPLCIQCESPSQTYQCEVKGPLRLKKHTLALYCLVATAKKYGHGHCVAKGRNKQSACFGKRVSYVYQGPSIPGITTDSRFGTQTRNMTGKQGHFSGNRLPRIDKGVPRNLKDFTAYSLQKTGDNVSLLGENTGKLISGTGDVIHNSAGKVTNFIGHSIHSTGKFIVNSGQQLSVTTEKTVKCVFSLFQKCGEQENKHQLDDFQTTTNIEATPPNNNQINRKNSDMTEYQQQERAAEQPEKQ